MITPEKIVKNIIHKDIYSKERIDTRFYKVSKRLCPECGTPYVKSRDSDYGEYHCYNCNKSMY